MECFTWRHGAKLQKRKYPKRKVALQAMHQTAKRYGLDPESFSVYKCKHCRKYHFGRDKQKQKCND